jgi:hypothetical protein
MSDELSVAFAHVAQINYSCNVMFPMPLFLLAENAVLGSHSILLLTAPNGFEAVILHSLACNNAS